MPSFSESVVEQAALQWFEELGYSTLNATEIAPGETNAERETYVDVVLIERLQNALERINPDLHCSAIQDAIALLTRADSPSLYENNRRFHKFLTDIPFLPVPTCCVKHQFKLKVENISNNCFR